jgi:phosphate-selective porin
MEAHTMRRITVAIAACTLALGLSASVNAATETVKGELVDVMCVKKDAMNKGADHADCAMKCAKKGAPLGIMTADAVYTITGDYTNDNNAKLLEFVSKNVEATGHVTEKDGKKEIHLESIKLTN